MSPKQASLPQKEPYSHLHLGWFHVNPKHFKYKDFPKLSVSKTVLILCFRDLVGGKFEYLEKKSE